jgi:HAMP domain-containing protein
MAVAEAVPAEASAWTPPAWAAGDAATSLGRLPSAHPHQARRPSRPPVARLAAPPAIATQQRRVAAVGVCGGLAGPLAALLILPLAAGMALGVAFEGLLLSLVGLGVALLVPGPDAATVALADTLSPLSLAAALAAWLSGKVTRPLTELQDFVRGIGRGDFASRIHMKSNDEFGELAEAINQMAEGLEERESLKGALVHYVRSQAADAKAASTAPSDSSTKRFQV